MPRIGHERLGGMDGQTVGCLQCHDHKYDPYTIGDFYKLSAFFADIHDDGFRQQFPTVRPPYLKAFRKSPEEMSLLKKEISELHQASGRQDDLKTWSAKLEGLRAKLAKERNKQKKAAVQKELQGVEKTEVAGVPKDVLVGTLKTKRLESLDHPGKTP